MSSDNALWKAAFTSIASNTNAAIMVSQMNSSEKDRLVSISLPGSVLTSPLQTQPLMVCRLQAASGHCALDLECKVGEKVIRSTIRSI
ncbi:hypothetical protein TNCV_4728501 [Trichonephila clavipes]|nr:hypothetical protein TNCV_4728501 [Trichonephila clavipes]